MGLEFISWANPDRDGAPPIAHPFWSTPALTPALRVRLTRPQLVGYNPPGTGTTYPLPTTDDAAGIARQTANWSAWLTDTWAAAGLTLGRRPPLFWHLWGHENELDPYDDLPDGAVNLVPGLERNWRDAVTIGAGFEAIEVAGPFHSQGIAGCYAFTRAIAEAMVSEFAGRGLALPDRAHWDFERGLDTDDSLPAGSGWWPPAIADARATDPAELIDGTHTLAQLWASATSLAGAPITVDTGANAYAAQNRDFNAWTQIIARKSMVHALGAGLLAALEDGGLTITESSNYHLHGCSRATPAPGNKVYAPWFDVEDLGAFTHSGLVLYPLKNAQISSGSTLADWLSYLGLTTTGDTAADVEAVWVARSKARIDADVAARPNALRLAWMTYPGQTAALDNIAPGFTHTASAAALLEIYAYALSRGVDRFYLWFDDGLDESVYDATADLLADVCALTTRSFVFL